HFWFNADNTLLDIADEFMEENPDIVIDVKNTAVATHLSELTTAIQTKETPDVFTMWPGVSIYPYYESDILMDLSDCDFVDEVNASALNASKIDGKVICAPVNTGYMGLAYNKTLFNSLDLSVPQNYSEFLTTLQTMKDNGISDPLILGKDMLLNFGSIMFTTDIYSANPNWDQEVKAGTKYFYDDNAKEVWKRLLIDLPEAGYCNFDTGINTDRMSKGAMAFLKGNAGYMQIGSWDISTLRELMKQPGANSEIGFIPWPGQTNGGSVLQASGEAFCLNAGIQGKQKQAAIKWLNYLMSDSVNRRICASIDSESAKVSVSVPVDPLISNIKTYLGNGTHGYMVWPLQVQNNLKELGNVPSAPSKLSKLDEVLRSLDAMWR
ncbi:MAG: extracellular solute-binding protein, partial [Clostridia bacterium]|nr:extracellular solute-binding protein [Clostridia bacterium]